MVAALIWSDGSLEDIDAIASRPQAGRIVPELKDPQVRERFLYSYRMIYGVRSDRIEILALLHGRRLLDSVSERFGDS